MKPRKMTIVVTVEDAAAMQPIYQAHMGHTLLHGCHIDSIASGDLLTRLTTIEESTDRILDLYAENKL